MIVSPMICGAGGGFTFSSNGKFQYPAEVSIPTSVTSLTGDEAAFKSHTEIEKIVFESGRTGSTLSIPTSCFQGCTRLTEITLPDNASITLQGSVFSGCNVLEKINFTENQTLTLNGDNAFYNCYALSQQTFESILSHFAANVTNLRSGTFYGCRAITRVELPSQITTLMNNAFWGCTSLETVILPDSETAPVINSYIFRDCTSLKTLIYRTDSVGSGSYISSSTNNPVFGCKALEDVQVPAGWKSNMFLSNGTSNFTNVLTHDSMVAMIANLYDYSDGTAHTLTLGATNLARLSEEEKAVATAKNWTLA